MSSATDRTEIEALFQRLARAHAAHDADAIADGHAPDAVIYGLASVPFYMDVSYRAAVDLKP